MELSDVRDEAAEQEVAAAMVAVLQPRDQELRDHYVKLE